MVVVPPRAVSAIAIFWIVCSFIESSNGIRPYVTCVGCETFLECFLTCPVADYPGVNRFGVYIPEVPQLLETMGLSEYYGNKKRPLHKRPLPLLKTGFIKRRGRKNVGWRPYNPALYTNYHKSY